MKKMRTKEKCDETTKWNSEGTRTIRKCKKPATWINDDWYVGQVKALCTYHRNIRNKPL